MKRATKPVSTAEILRVLREVERVLMHNDPEGHRAEYVIAPEDFAVRELCERVGFGAVMDSAARQWRAADSVGAFTTGATVGAVQDALKMVVGLAGRLSSERAEIRDLRARLKACREAWFDPAGDGVDDERIDRATDLRRKNWREP